MLIRNNPLCICCKIFVFVAALFGVLLQCGLFSDTLNLSCLTYFTLMTNMACVVYYLPAAVHQAKYKSTFLPTAKGALLMCVCVTGLVYHFMLNGRFEMQGTIQLSNILLHYVVPIGTFLDWILFHEKGYFTKKSALKWQLAPLGYLIFVLIAVQCGAQLGPYGAKYPYFFLDVETMGVPTFVITCLVMGACFYLLGLLLVWIDKQLAKKTAGAQS